MNPIKPSWPRLIPAAMFLGGFLLYVSTLAPSVVFGDPAEYTFVPYLWGVLHPPGYAFETLLVKAWQTLLPIGSVAYRTNLLSAAAASLTLALVYGIVVRVVGILSRESKDTAEPVSSRPILLGLLAAALLAVAPDFWQHAIHTNAHIVTATLAALALYCLVRWYTEANDRWLYAFGFAAGLSVTHHPLLALSFPAYAVFILAVQPGILTQWARGRSARISPDPQALSPNPSAPKVARPAQNLVVLGACFLLGLSPWLYFPIRSSLGPPPVSGPHDMNTVEGFMNLALARGLTVNLFHFGLNQQWQRAIVFWDLLRLQLPFLVIALIPAGLISLWRRERRIALLFTLYLVINLAFIFNTVQDVMAYFLVPLLGLAMLAGLGAHALVEWTAGQAIWGPASRSPTNPASGRLAARDARILLVALLAFPLTRTAAFYPRINLQNYRAADAYVDGLFERFESKGEGAVLLSDWEHLTPLWYRQYVEGHAFVPEDLTPVFVSGGERPWVDAVWRNIEAGPIYVIEYQPQIAAEGFRLRADGDLYRVLLPPATEAPNIAYPLNLNVGGQIEVLGYDLGTTSAKAGEVIPFTLYLRAPEPVSDILFPYATLGPYRFDWTTDSHLLTPAWQAGEVIAERFDLTVPLDVASGELPLALGFSDLSTGENLAVGPPTADGRPPEGNAEQPLIEIARIQVEANPAALAVGVLDELEANFGQRVGIEAASARAGGRRVEAPWPEPIEARPGTAIQLFINWRALARPENSLTVFVHLLDSGNAVWAAQDYTPLGGAFPTMLWFPKWLEGQTVIDPYVITVPPEAPPGDYYIEVGLYGLRSIQRVPAFDREGNLAGDRFVMGTIRVIPP